MLCTSMAPRVASATAPDPRRSDEGIALATSWSSNDGDGAVPPQPTNMLQIFNSMGAQHQTCVKHPREVSYLASK